MQDKLSLEPMGSSVRLSILGNKRKERYMKKVMFEFGTRREAIRMCPLVKENIIIIDEKCVLDRILVDGWL